MLIKRILKVNMEELAERLNKLSEDDMLAVIKMIHGNKTPETYIKNYSESMFERHMWLWNLVNANRSIENEFHVDLYSLSDSLIKMLWDFTSEGWI